MSFKSLIKRQGNQVIYKSPYVKQIDFKPATLVEIALTFPSYKLPQSRELYIDAKDPNHILTFGSNLQGIVAIANYLQLKYQLQPGDVVCLFLKNDIHIPQTHIAILANGAVITPANNLYLPKELNYQLNKTRSKIVITSPEFIDTVNGAIELGNDGEKSTVQHVLFLKDLVREAYQSCKYTEKELYTASTDHLFKLLPPAASQIDVNDHAYYCFSSGTSGVSKGVVSTHSNLVAQVRQQGVAMEKVYKSTSVFGAYLPISHIYGLIQFIYVCPYFGTKLVMLPEFDFELLLSSIEKYAIEYIHIVPPTAVLLAKSPIADKYPKVKNSLTGLICGAAPLSKDLSDMVEKRFDCSMWQVYGLTETSPMTHCFGHDLEKFDAAAIGWLVPGMEARLVAPDGTDIGTPYTRGELWLKGPNVFKGYLDNEEATRSSFATIDQGSGNGDPTEWFKTGDVVEIDELGLYYVVDRVKEMIKSKGHQVAPAELEDVLHKNDSIADCAVTGLSVPEEGTEYPRAFVVFKEGVVKTSEAEAALDLIEWFNKQVAKHKRLWGGVVILKEIPKSPSGKILRRFLGERMKDENAKVYGYNAKAKL